MAIKCVVVDDDPVICELLACFVSDNPNLLLAAKFTDPLQAKHFLGNTYIPLLFADMEMPGETGIELVQDLHQKPYVIFITSHRDYAVESYELDAIDYILKPVKQSRFDAAVEKALRHITQNRERGHIEVSKNIDDYFFIRADAQFVRIKYADVVYIEALKDFVKIHTAVKNHIALVNLKNIEEAMPFGMFLRTHRSYLVNKNHILAINTHDIETTLENVPLGNSYKENVMDAVLGNKLIKR